MFNVQVAQYRGTSFISKCIKWITRSEYSHSAFLINGETCIEMWDEGLREEPSLSIAHTPGTVVDVYSIEPPLTSEQTNALILSIEKDLKQEPRIKYDFKHVLTFLPLFRVFSGEIRKDDTKKQFCSEYVFRKLEQVECKLLNVDAFKVAPGDVAKSLRLKLSYNVVTD